MCVCITDSYIRQATFDRLLTKSNNKHQLNSFVLIMTIIGCNTCPVTLFVVVELYAIFAHATYGLKYITYNKR
jgi:predicted ThiF/HesA family dinucleotide-utilizing enzyme